jgi:phosphatidylserine/phosphatidylglycerophosphate/cardiolipin synthase-like enzyme
VVDALEQAAGVACGCVACLTTTARWLSTARQRLLDAGVYLRWYNRLRWKRGLRNLYRDHRNCCWWTSVGRWWGHGRYRRFWTPGEATSEWHEVMVQMQGPLVSDWQLLFDRQWQANNRRTAWRPAEGWPAAPAQGARRKGRAWAGSLMPTPASTRTSCMRW